MNIRKLNRLDTLIEKQRESGRLQGATILVEHKGKRVYENHYEPDREDSIYKIFSMTKPVTAVAAMMLYERGDLDLMSKVSDYLPGYGKCKVVSSEGIRPATTPMRIKDLLNMTSGIVYSGDFGEAERLMAKIYKEARTQRGSGILRTNVDVCNKLAEAGIAFEPGEGRTAADSSFEHQSLYLALRTLPPKERSAITLFYLNGYNIKEIAAIIETSEDAVKKQLSRGRDKLKEKLKI